MTGSLGNKYVCKLSQFSGSYTFVCPARTLILPLKLKKQLKATDGEKIMKYFFFLLILSLIVISSDQGLAGNLQDKFVNEDDVSGSIIIEGTELTYRVEGTGPSILLVGSNLEYFSKNLRNHFRLYFIDTRYTAKNYTPIDPENYTLETLYKDIDSMRSVLGLDNLIIGGHSIYGVIAYEYAKRYPEYVSHIVMIGTPSTYGTKAHQDAVNDY